MTSTTQPKVDNKGLGAILCGHSSLSPPNSLCLPSYHSWTTPHPLHLQRRATLPLLLINQDFLLSSPDNPAVTARAFWYGRAARFALQCHWKPNMMNAGIVPQSHGDTSQKQNTNSGFFHKAAEWTYVGCDLLGLVPPSLKPGLISIWQRWRR